MKITTFKFQFFAGVTIFLLFSGISVYAQSPNETDSLQTEEISSDNRMKLNGYLRAGIFGGENEIRNYYGEGALKLGVPVAISASAFSEVRYRANSNNNHKFDIREAYLNLNLGKFDFRVGEQIVLWGACRWIQSNQQRYSPKIFVHPTCLVTDSTLSWL